MVLIMKNPKLDIKIYPLNEKIDEKNKASTTKAFASVTIEDLVAINSIRVVEGSKGLFVSMPQSMDKEGNYHDIAFPVSGDLRKALNKAVLEEYHSHLKKEYHSLTKKGDKLIVKYSSVDRLFSIYEADGETLKATLTPDEYEDLKKWQLSKDADDFFKRAKERDEALGRGVTDDTAFKFFAKHKELDVAAGFETENDRNDYIKISGRNGHPWIKCTKKAALNCKTYTNFYKEDMLPQHKPPDEILVDMFHEALKKVRETPIASEGRIKPLPKLSN
jgi:stage V sporulation protein G